MVNERFHGQIVIVSAVQDDLLYPCQRQIVSTVNDCRYDIRHLRIGAFQCSVRIRLSSVQAKDAFRDDARKRYDQHDQNRQEQTDTNQNFIEGVAHGPGSR